MSGGSSRRSAGSSSWHSSFSRLFHRSLSKEPPEEEGKAAPQPQGADSSFEIKENESTNMACRRKESNPLPELLKISVFENKNFSTEELSRSPTQEEFKKTRSLPSLAHQGKTTSNDKQPKEGFLQFLGSLFGIASKSSLKETDQSILRDDNSRIGKDVESPANHQKSVHPKVEKSSFSVSGNVCGASANEEKSNTCSNLQDLQEAQEQTDEALKKTDCELGAPAVTYATYRGSARIKQLLKKQAKNEQEKETPTSTNSSTAKNNQIVDLPEAESTTTKPGLPLETNSKSETKDNKKDAQSNTSLSEMGLKGNVQDVLSSSDNREPYNAITSLTETEAMKNCIKQVLSVEHVLVANTEEVKRNLLLEPILLSKEASSTCENTDTVVVSSPNNRLVEKGEKVLGETETQLLPNNTTVVDFQTGMHFCPLSSTETKQTIQNKFSPYPKVYSFDDEQQLLKNRDSSRWVDDQVTLKSDDSILYLNNLCSGQEASNIANGNEGSHEHLTEEEEQTLQINHFSNAHLPVHAQKHGEEMRDVDCNQTSTSSQPLETVQEIDTHGNNINNKSQGTVEAVELSKSDINFTMVSKTETNYVTMENFCLPFVEGGHVEFTNALPNITQVSNASASLSLMECENVEYCVPYTSLEIKDNHGTVVAPVDISPIIPEAKDGYCHYLDERNDDTLIQTSVGLDESLPPPEGETTLLDFEKPKLISTGSFIMAKPSCLQTAETVTINSPAISARKNDPLVCEMTNHFGTETVPTASEIKEMGMIDLLPVTLSKDGCLTQDSPPFVKPENSSSPAFLSSTSTSVFANNFFIVEDKMCLGNTSKPVPNSEDQSPLKTSCLLLDEKHETTYSSARANSSKIDCSTSARENIHVIQKSEICGHLSSLTAANFGGADQISDTFQESVDIPETKVISDNPENANVGSEIFLCSGETKETSGSYSLGFGSSLLKQILPISTCEDVYACKLASPTSCETIDGLGRINSFPINSEDRVTISPEHKSDSPLVRSATKTACPTPSVDSVASDVEGVHPINMVLEKAFTIQQEKKVHKTPSEQVNRPCLVASASENPGEMGNQAVTALFTKSSRQFSDKILKDVETGKQVQIRLQDLSVLIKKADEIVEAVLYLAIEEIRSKQAAGACQANEIKGNLLGSCLQKDQKTRTIFSDSEETQLKNLSLTHFNETCIGRLSGIERQDTVDTEIPDEMIQFNITDKIDLCSSLALIAKEITGGDVNVVKKTLTYSEQEKNLIKGPSQNTIESKTEEQERLFMDTKLTAKLSETTKEHLSLSQAHSAVVYDTTVDCEIASSLPLLEINIKDNEVTRGEMISHKVLCQDNGEKCASTVRLDSVPATEGDGKNSQDVRHSIHMTDAGGKVSDWTTGNKSGYSLRAGNGESATTREQLLSCQFVPENVSLPAFSSNVHTYTCLSNKSKGEYELLDLLGNNSRSDMSKYSHNYSNFPFFASEEPHENDCEIDSERTYGKIKKACTQSQDKNGISESSAKSNSPKVKSDFASEEEEITAITMDGECKENYLDDAIENFPQCFAVSLPEEWARDPSFTILYDDVLQEESCSSIEPGNSLPLLPDLSLNNTEHLLMYETTKGKLNCVQTYNDRSQSNENLDSTCPESFMTVEAKRCRVYPFSLSPIYEDDSSQEDLLSADISPECHSREKSIDSSNPSSSVLSLLQSVSERLKATNQYVEEENMAVCEENKMEDEKEAYIPSCWADNTSATILGNVHERNLLSRHSHPLSKEMLSAEEALCPASVHPAKLLQSYDLDIKPFPRSLFYEYLQNAGSYTGEKGARSESLLLTKDHQTKYNDFQKLGAFQVSPIDREKLRCGPRPGKMVICDLKDSKNKHEIYHDKPDTTAWMFSKEVLIRIVRGCWILYEKPQFQGQNFVLEEGEKLLNAIWNTHIEEHKGNITIGSVRLVKNYSVPEIEFCPQTDTDHSPICIQNAVADLEELEVKISTLLVKAGVWLAYSDANYKGNVMVLEENHNLCELSAADVKSLHPLKMGGLKVQMPMNVKMVIYEKPHFEGWCKEISENIDYVPALFTNSDHFQGIGSLYVIGGIWVAYEKERYKGQQYLLEEGEYDDWQSWDGVSKVLLSFRFLQADFMQSEVTLFERDEENGKLFEIVNQDIPDLDQAGFGLITRSLNVKSGVWVAYQQKYFCGEQYILEKGKYKCFLDWGGLSETIMSIRPIKLEPLDHHTPRHWLKAFSSTHFQGMCMDFTTDISDFSSFKPCSFKVLRGCWLLRYQEETTDNQCVLEEGLYTDLASCGCPVATIVSLQPIEYVFAESFISLFALENCEGRELHLQEAVSSVLNKDLHFLTQSVWVRSGQWIAYEGSNFLGNQFLLEPSKILNWTQFSGWKVIGSLRPVKQPAVYFRIKNRSQDKYLTVVGNLIDARATSVCLFPLNGKDTQIWFYRRGLIKSKVNDACLDVIGGRDVPGAKVALWVEHGKVRQKWTLNPDGTISSYLSDQLVLDLKGGYYYDKNHIVLNQFSISECTQRWDFEIL